MIFTLIFQPHHGFQACHNSESESAGFKPAQKLLTSSLVKIHQQTCAEHPVPLSQLFAFLGHFYFSCSQHLAVFSLLGSCSQHRGME